MNFAQFCTPQNFLLYFYTCVLQITDATTVDDVRKLAGEQFDLLSSCGFVKPTSSISLDDRAVIVKALFLHHTLLQSKAEIDQYNYGRPESIGCVEFNQAACYTSKAILLCWPKGYYSRCSVAIKNALT